MDGVNNTEPNFNSYIFQPSIDAIQEFKVQSGIYSSEFGRGVGQVNGNLTITASTKLNNLTWANPYLLNGNNPSNVTAPLICLSSPGPRALDYNGGLLMRSNTRSTFSAN